MNEENGERARKALGENARFFVVDVSDTESVESCVKSIGEWVSSTGHPIGGVVAAAGVGNPGKVGVYSSDMYYIVQADKPADH